MWRCSARRPRARPMDSIHFGFHVEDADVIAGRLKNWDIVGPTDRPREALAAASSRQISQLQTVLRCKRRQPLVNRHAAGWAREQRLDGCRGFPGIELKQHGLDRTDGRWRQRQRSVTK